MYSFELLLLLLIFLDDSLMARGGLQQITKWLMQASMEEQTSLIRVLLKVHFPLKFSYCIFYCYQCDSLELMVSA